MKMKAFLTALAASATLLGSCGVGLAQYGDAVPIQRGYGGQPVCPSNYVVRGNACVSIYAGRGGGGYDDRSQRGGYDDSRRGRYRGEERSHRGGREAVEPRINYRGEPQCPSNFVIRGGMCVSIYR